jgi:spermidine synthase
VIVNPGPFDNHAVRCGMIEINVRNSTKSAVLIPILAAASGAASLTYQVVWMRRLALVFGSTTLATSTVLAAFLGGLAIGAWLWGRLADSRPQSTLVFFALIEMATGIYGLLSLPVFRVVQAMYLAVYPSLANHTGLFTGVQFILSALAILLPTVLMGASLPLLARFNLSKNGGMVGAAGAIYGWNTLGAACGAASTTYALLPALGLSSTIALAASVNILVGASAIFMRSRKRAAAPSPGVAADLPLSPATSSPAPDRLIEFLILAGFAASGFAATTFEVSWTRLLAMVMGSSVYAFGTLVVVVLVGLGLGSSFYSLTLRKTTTEGHRRWFAILEFLIACTTALSLIILPRIPFLFIRYFPLFRDAFRWQIAAHFAAAAMVAFLPSLFFGATFPAVVGGLGGTAARFGRTIGAAYVANTIGTVAGAGLAGFVLIPTIGLRGTMTLGVLATAVAGFALWWRITSPRLPRIPELTPALAALLIIALLPAWPREVFAAGIGFFAPRLDSNETLADVVNSMRLLYYRDGFNTTISVDQTGQNIFYRSNGKTDASTNPVDMANQLLLGHLPMLLHPAPRDVFVLGLGTGITAAAIARYPVRQIDIVELEPAAAQAARFFDSYSRKVLDDPRVHLIIGDGRNRLLGTPKQYDVIVSDPSDIWVAGTGSLTTIEYYRIVAARLRPNGIFAQWVHTHALQPDDLELLAATFHAVFPHMQIWTSAPGNLIFLGTRDSVPWDYARLKQRFSEVPGVANDLQVVGVLKPFALFGAQVLGENESALFVRDVDGLHTDDHPVLEFRTPRSLYVDTTPMIAQELSDARNPEAPAIVGFDPAHDLDAENAYLLGFAFATVGQMNEAITYMEQSTKMAPDRPLYFVGLGNQYRAAGRTADARAAYERALELDINNVEALLSLGEMRLDEGQLTWTRVLAERALLLAPQDARAHDLLGKLDEAER